MNSLKTALITGALGVFMIAPSAANAQASVDDLERMQTFLQIMQNYFDIIESTHAVGADSEKSAIMQMQKIQEVYEERGEKARSVDVLRQVLSESQNQTIRNAAYMLLSDTLKEIGRSDESIELLRQGLAENIRAAK